MSLTNWLLLLRRKHLRFRYRLEVVGSTCHLALYGAWDMDQAPLVMEQAIAKLLKQSWTSLRVDCRRVRPLDRQVLDTAFVATMVRLVRLVTERANTLGHCPDWSFRFRMREQTKVLAIVKLEKTFEGHIFYERRSFGLNRKIVLRPPRLLTHESEADNTA
ncbi:MAG: hypothetical protein HUU49_04050 [Candidatus Buchananbacteria bacterium]|nr:hypothetical protein [Candidatus Buchananbacteria bacterium]